jgi:hypothetical protein
MLNKLAEIMVSLHIRVIRSSTNCRAFLQCILHTSHVVENAREDPFQWSQIFTLKEVHLRQLST